jgi:membrane fusion protein, multidrug efflux system
MFANLNLTLNVRENAIVIPETALSRVMDDSRAMVFIVDENSAAQMKPVKLGIRLSGHVEILEGLQAGEKVIVEGLQKIGPGASVKIAAPQTNPSTNTSAVK